MNCCIIRTSFSLLFILLTLQDLQSQQSNTLFFMHAIPESNFINPAVQIECKVFVGLPAISSLHMHASNNSFTVNQLLKKEGDSIYRFDANGVLPRLAQQNLVTTEAYATILAVGIKRDDYYYTFLIQEKDNMASMYSKDLAEFMLKGNTPFEGQWIDLKGTGVVYNHVREFALGVSKKQNSRYTWGIRGKLLFGKLNLTTGRGNIRMFTHPNTFDLDFETDAGFNSSLPYSLDQDQNGNLRIFHVYGGDWKTFAFNRKNPGLAFDAGFIYKYSDRLTLSGSVLDLGLIWYRSNLTNYSMKGNLQYQGPGQDSAYSERYLQDVWDAINGSVDTHLSYHSYVFFMDPRIYLGATWKLNNRVDGNLLLYNRILSAKVQTSVTASVVTHPLKHAEASVSWSYMNRSALNLGVGLAYGRSPIQLYVVTDNLIGLIFPMDTHNINLRFGMNLHFGCKAQVDLDACGCSWLKKAEEKQEKREKWKSRQRR